MPMPQMPMGEDAMVGGMQMPPMAAQQPRSKTPAPKSKGKPSSKSKSSFGQIGASMMKKGK